MFSSHIVACENIRFSSLFADRDVSRGGTCIVPPPETSPSAKGEEKRMFSQATHVDMICKNSAFQDIFVKLLFIEYRLSKDTPYMRKWWVSTFQQIVEFITNFGSITKGAKPLNFSKALYEQHAFLIWKLFIKLAVSVFKVFFSPLFQYTRNTCIAERRKKAGGGGNQKIKGLETWSKKATEIGSLALL